MTGFFLRFLIGTLLLAGVSIAGFAEDIPSPSPTQTEITGVFGAYEIQKSYPSQFVIAGDSLGVGIGHTITELLEASARIRFNQFSSTDQLPGGTKLFMTFGPTLNFAESGRGLANAFYFSAGVGFNYNRMDSFQLQGTYYNTAAMSTLGLAYSLEIGKRFELFPNVSWMPNFSVSSYTGTDIFNNNLSVYPLFAFVPLGFSIHF